LYGGPAGRQSNAAIVRWMDEIGLAPGWLLEMDWGTFDVASASPLEVRRLEEALSPFFLELTKQEFFKGAVERRILGYAVASVVEIAADEQLAAREAWQELGGVPHPTP